MHHVGVPLATLAAQCDLGHLQDVTGRCGDHALYALQVPPAAPRKAQAPTNGSSGADGSVAATPAAVPNQDPAPEQDAAAKAPDWELEAKQDAEVVNLAVMKNGVRSMASCLAAASPADVAARLPCRYALYSKTR